jgi:hypothetical protein
MAAALHHSTPPQTCGLYSRIFKKDSPKVQFKISEDQLVKLCHRKCIDAMDLRVNLTLADLKWQKYLPTFHSFRGQIDRCWSGVIRN